MKTFNSVRFAFGVAVVAVLITGCNGGGYQPASAGDSLPVNAARSIANDVHNLDLSRTLLVPPRAASIAVKRPVLHPHAMTPHCCGYAKLLYVSDASGGSSFTGAVEAYKYPSGTYVGQVAPPPEGFFEPQGMCVDASGDVFVANTASSTIDEYSHGGSFVRALADPGQYPVGCSYDRSTGNLAVSNIFDINFSTGGSVAIYAHAHGRPTLYVNAQMFSIYFLGYAGTSGTLYLDGRDASGAFQYASFSGGAFTPITIAGATIKFPGSVVWSAKTKSMNVGDQDSSSGSPIYQVSPIGQVTGTTTLTCGSPPSSCGAPAFDIKGPVVIVPDPVSDTVGLFPYPAGGSATSTITTKLEPDAVAVSPAKSGM